MTAAILLSASYPEGERGEAVRPYDTADIALASTLVVEGALRADRPLVFGGHPTISPIVLTVAHTLKKGHLVRVFQSEYFRKSITPEVWRLIESEGAQLHWTPDEGDRGSSLARLRDEMLQQRMLAAFFVGGMDGIAREAEALGDRQPATVQFFFSRPGGMAAQVLTGSATHEDEDDPALDVVARRKVILRGRGYPRLVINALAYLDEDMAGSSEL